MNSERVVALFKHVINYLKLTSLNSRLWNWIEHQRNRLWVLPLIVVIGFILTSEITIRLDDWQYENQAFTWPHWIFQGDVTAAQSILTSIAAATASIVSLVISMAMVVFSIASSQYGPMLLRNFIIDLRLQIGFGGFVGTFAYCLLVLRVLNYTENNVYVPTLSLSLAIALSISSLFALIYVVHHVANNLRVETLVKGVCRQLKETLKRRYPNFYQDDVSIEKSTCPQALDNPYTISTNSDVSSWPWIVVSDKSGYVQTIDQNSLLDMCQTFGFLMHVFIRPGHHVIDGQALISFMPCDSITRANNHNSFSNINDLRKSLLSAIEIGEHRNPVDDPEYAIDQLVEVALVALSPGINRTYTAIMCIDQLIDAMAWLGKRHIPNNCMYFPNGQPAMWLHEVQFSNLFDAAIDKIRQNAKNNEAVTIHLLQAFGKLIHQLPNKAHHNVVKKHAQALMESVKDQKMTTIDRNDINTQYGKFASFFSCE
jgi:uncharacterized membrane protein